MYEEEKKYQQRWEFRDVGDRFNDSSSEDDCSTSNKKHKLLSDMLLETEEEPFANSPLSNSRSYRKSKKDKRVVIRSHSPNKKEKKKKESISLDGLKMFMESMLGELRVERESMFSRMREEMKRMDSSKKVNPKKVSHMMMMMMHQQKIEENPETNNGFDSSNGKIERLVKKPLEAGGGTESDMTVGSEIVDLLTSPNISAGFLSGGGEQLCKKISMNTTSTTNINEMNGFNLYGAIHHHFSNVGRSGDGFAAVPPLHMGNGNGNGTRNNNVFGLRISGGAIRFSSAGGNHNNNNLVADYNDDEIWQSEAKI